MKKLPLLLVAIIIIAMMTATSVYAAEQGLNATFVKFSLSKEDFDAAMFDEVTPEELFDSENILDEYKIVDTTAFFIEDPDLKAKGVEILQIENAGGEDPEQWGIKWEGTLIPAESGKYTFHLRSDNGFLLKIDDKVVLDYWQDAWDEDIDGETIDLEAGKKYRVEAWWFDNYGGSYYKVWWSKDGGEKQQIPLSCLSTEVLPKPSPTPTPTPTLTPTQTQKPAATTTKPATTSGPTATQNSGNETEGPSPVIFIIIAVVVIAIGVVAFLVISKKKKA